MYNYYFGGTIYTIMVFYAFIYWGIIWGIVNIFVPFSMLYDIAIYLGTQIR